ADSNQTKTSLIAVKLGLTGFILPFFFLDNPVLLIGSSASVPILLTIRAILTSSIGAIALSAGLQGYLLKNTSLIERGLLIISGLLFIATGLTTDVIALVILLSLIILQYIQTHHHKERVV
ncbi:MAG: TRAP transporter permease, partial [Sphaerochaeta sp.]